MTATLTAPSVIDELRAKLGEILEARATAHKAGGDIIEKARAENRDLTPEEAVKVEEYRTAKKAADAETEPLRARIAELEDDAKRDAAAAELRRELGQTGGIPGTYVKSEPEVYTRGGLSWFADRRLVMAGSSDAGERLTRNNRMAAERRAVDLNTTAGTGGEFAPPLWLIDLWVKLARAGRVTCDLIGSRPLPPGVSSINLPKVSTGSQAGVQSSQGSSVQDTALTTTSVSSGIQSIAGQQTVSLQLLEQSGINFDEVILFDLAADYAKQLDTQVHTAAASAPWTGGGLQNVASVNAVTYTQASPTVAGSGQFYAQLANAIQLIAVNRFMPATSILMHPRRWGWMLAAFDSQNRTLLPVSGAGFNTVGVNETTNGYQTATPVGEVLGLPVYVDANIPTNIGAGTNQDVVYVLRESDLYFYETPLNAASFDATFAGSLEMLFRVYAYSAFIPHRYPKSITAINGTGLVTPSF